MKRLFTLLMVLLIASAGYSQVKQVSRNDSKKDVATVQQFNGFEALKYVENAPTMTRSDGELDYTIYDWQSNDGPRTWTHVWPDGKVNFAYTYASDASFTTRGTSIGTYDAVNDVWTGNGSRIEAEKTGFGSMARYGENGIVVAAHTATAVGVYLIEDRNNLPQGTVTAVSYLPTAYDACWANVMTSGADRNIIHVICTANGATVNGMTDPMIYFRSQDGGQTWDKADVILPYMGNEYSIDWTSNCCYWMETTEDNCLALVVNNAWSDGMVLYSYDNGETWERKVFYSHPNPTGDYTNTWFMYPRWTSCQWDSQDNLHVAYEFNGTTGVPGSGSYYPALGGVAYWNENMPYNTTGTTVSAITGNLTPGQPFVMDSAYMYSDIYASWWGFSDATHTMWPEYMGYLTTLTDDGEWEDPYTATEFKIEDRSLHGPYNSGVCAFPVLCMVPGSDDMVAVWSALDENNTDGTNFYYKIFASASVDGGLTWTTMKHLTNEFIYSYSEFVYNQAVVIGDQLIIAAQADGGTGTYVQGDDADGADNLYQGLTFDINELWPNIGLGVEENVNHMTTISIYPNPVENQMNVTLNEDAEVVICNILGQVVSTFNGHAGANSVDVSTLNSGIYVISAGSANQRFVVK